MASKPAITHPSQQGEAQPQLYFGSGAVGLQAQIDALTAALADLQARVTTLEGNS
jgi:hypothetical protein